MGSASGASALAYLSGRRARAVCVGGSRTLPTPVLSLVSARRRRLQWAIASSPRTTAMRP
eukprot:8357482-Alexandrium_andersonii.AAC.1